MTWKITTFLMALVATIGFTAATSLLGAGSNSAAAVAKDDKAAKTVKIGGIDFYVDYDAALKVAKAKKLPVWLHFGENPG